MERKDFIRNAGAMGLIISTGAGWSFKPQDEEQLDRKMVQEFVGASHRDMDKVKEMLEAYPTLLNAAHDWKYGDFETGLGAASHVGYKELAKYFLEKGAQANIFTACLFGEFSLVKTMLDAFPQALHAKGPHGFTLLHHAEKGGDDALEVKEYLVSLGAVDKKIALY
ncbi:ankyrin repeat domain-containing protein [Muriicola soli]|uniref:Ankyrin repeat domain-containing protein n=1 Tax=Muriicola soli TaxID=2507538 RepID=A0A411E930_9FLAO|nr:ankyrin repeat domain-containing protein [Muriicola soli]QBA64053.1 ankyrin repeat domain-containing protein [Muriicola soli]